MEGLVTPDQSFWNVRRVFLTGHTGFKGSWLSTWLKEMGAIVRGYALDPPTDPSLFLQADVGSGMDSVIADIRSYVNLHQRLTEFEPEVVFHLAAQPLVRDSYRIPRDTYETNVMGTVNVLEAVRHCESVRSLVVVTTDKVYENREWPWGYRENDRLGGCDPYSSSKAATELAVAAYRGSFFNPVSYGREHRVAIATARAGNVIGGGDWAVDRLLPDLMRAWLGRRTAFVRNPGAIRPWQHVLEPLSGYLVLAEQLHDSVEYASEWNFGPRDTDCIRVGEIVELLERHCQGLEVEITESGGPHEAAFLKLDISKAEARLGWQPRWPVEAAVLRTQREYSALASGENCLHRSIAEYIGD